MSLYEKRTGQRERAALRARVRVIIRRVLLENESLCLDNEADSRKLERELLEALLP